MAEPGCLPLTLRSTVGLSLRMPALHQQPAQRDEAKSEGSLLPVVAQARQADVHALAGQQRTHRHRHVDDDAADTKGANERQRRWRRRWGAALCQYRSLGALAAALDELTV